VACSGACAETSCSEPGSSARALRQSDLAGMITTAVLAAITMIARNPDEETPVRR
jgi:hypothetical protein